MVFPHNQVVSLYTNGDRYLDKYLSRIRHTQKQEHIFHNKNNQSIKTDTHGKNDKNIKIVVTIPDVQKDK